MSAAGCPVCGTALESAVCPRCILQDVVDELSTPELARIGTRIGHYEILGLLGSGGMGTVYAARQEGLEREVALKVLGPLAGERDVARFLREARALARLRHPGIVSVHEVGSDGEVHYYAMDRLEGPTLADVVGEGKLEPGRAAGIVLAVARAVAHAHDNGIVHRDLKSANILLDREGEPVVADFGLALDLRQDHQLTRSGVALGTGPYMAPEQVSRRHGPIGPATDVYGLGAVLYECLTGAPPFWDDDLYELFRKVQFEPPIPPWEIQHAVDRGLGGIALRALEKDPTRRYGSAREMVLDLALYLEDGPKAVELRLATGRDRRRRERAFLRLCRLLALALPLAGIALGILAVRAVREEDRHLDRIGISTADRLAPLVDELAASPEAASGQAEGRLEDEALRERRIFFLVVCRDGSPVLSTAPLPEGMLEKARAEEREPVATETPGLALSRADFAHVLEPGESRDALRAFSLVLETRGAWTAWIILSRRDLLAKETRFLQQAGLFVALYVLVLVPLVVARPRRERG